MEWISCTIGPGQFSDEFAVSGRDYRGKGFSLFAPANVLQFSEQPTPQPVQGYMLVRILDSKDSLRLVKLPARPMENGDVITVSADQLSRRPAHQTAMTSR